jgi:SAM-dependent methyltransferase
MLADAGIESGLVIDLGCGSGIAAALFVDAGYDVLGVDVSEAMVEIARARVPGAEFVSGSLHDVALPGCQAVVAMGEIASYAGIDDALLRRVREALAPGGLFVFDVATPGRGSSRSWQSGEGWVVCADAVEDGTSLRRSIVSFREAEDAGGWRRTDEVHELALYDPAAIVESLTAAGFTGAAVLEDGYGPQLELPAGIAVLSARTPGW